MVVMAEEEVMMMDMISNLMYRIEGRGPGLMFMCKCVEQCSPGIVK